MGTLYLVATPIGNLEDLSPRAVRVLGEALLIAAEDTRHTGKLLKHFKISTRLTSYFEHNKLNKIDTILTKLVEGDVAVVSDAGSPGINDPGYELVRAALASGFDVRPVPGPSAPIAALTVSGLPTDNFLYLGYLPHKSGERQAYLRDVADLSYTLVLLESPYRIIDALKDILSTLGDRPICVAREMTKMFEEYWRGTVNDAMEYFQSQPARGEFTLILGGAEKGQDQWAASELTAAITSGLKAGELPSQLSKRLAAESGWSKREVYRLIQEQKQQLP
jgi:16S rRNA (cytidine1402-2'-O)-methyltransferase